MILRVLAVSMIGFTLAGCVSSSGLSGGTESRIRLAGEPYPAKSIVTRSRRLRSCRGPRARYNSASERLSIKWTDSLWLSAATARNGAS